MITYEHHQKICVLINGGYFFLSHVYILIGKNTYRLIVIHNRELLVNEQYQTLRGAKIAFSKKFKFKAYKKAKPKWSRTYHPIQGWHDEKMQGIKRNHDEH